MKLTWIFVASSMLISSTLAAPVPLAVQGSALQKRMAPIVIEGIDAVAELIGELASDKAFDTIRGENDGNFLKKRFAPFLKEAMTGDAEAVREAMHQKRMLSPLLVLPELAPELLSGLILGATQDTAPVQEGKLDKRLVAMLPDIAMAIAGERGFDAAVDTAQKNGGGEDFPVFKKRLVPVLVEPVLVAAVEDATETATVDGVYAGEEASAEV